MTRRALASLVRGGILLLLALPAGGCWFATREASPGGEGETVWVPPTSPDIVVENLRAALEAGVFGDYIRAFTTDFAFEPDGTDVTQLAIERPGQAVYDGWNRDVETQTAEEIAAGASELHLVFTLLSEQVVDEGRLQKYDYVLTLVRGTTPEVYQGQAWFEIRLEPTGDWLISHWLDVITPETVDSWGRLKGRTRPL